MQDQLNFYEIKDYMVKGLISLIPDEIVINTRPIKNILSGNNNFNGKYISFRYDSIARRSYPENIVKDIDLKEVVYVVPEKFREQYSLENGMKYNK